MYIDSKLVDYLYCITSSVYQLCNVAIIHFFFCPKNLTGLGTNYIMCESLSMRHILLLKKPHRIIIYIIGDGYDDVLQVSHESSILSSLAEY